VSATEARRELGFSRCLASKSNAASVYFVVNSGREWLLNCNVRPGDRLPTAPSESLGTIAFIPFG
jgi:hypothetical protein